MPTACTTVASQVSGPAASGPDSLTVEVRRTWHYLVQLPKGYAQDGREWPLVVFLHRSGERGADLSNPELYVWLLGQKRR